MLDLSGFVSPPSDVEGIDKLTNTLVRKRQQDIYNTERRQAKKAASTKFITNYLDDQEKFTGTKYDPINHQLLSGALTDAMDLINQGADVTDVMAAISPKVNKASQYTLAAQAYAQNKKNYIQRLKDSGAKGIDLEKLSSEIDKQAFPDGVDVSKVDPNINYGDMALKNGDVFNNEGFDEEFKKAPRNTEVGTVKYTNKKGAIEREKVKLTAPFYAVSEKDADGNHIGFVPKFQVAKDEGNDLIHTFETENGKVDAPIRLYDKELFDAMPASEKAYLLQETRKYAKQKGVDLSSVQAENFARALAYDEKKARINGTYEHVEETKEAPAPKISIRVSQPSKSDIKAQITQNDLHQALNESNTDADGKIDATPYLGGITFLTNSKGKRISQPSVSFDPKDKTFTFTDNETGIPETVSFAKFKSMASASNPQSDLGFLEGFRTYKRSVQPEIKPKEDNTKGFFNKVVDFFKSNTNTDKPKESKPTKKDPLGLGL